MKALVMIFLLNLVVFSDAHASAAVGFYSNGSLREADSIFEHRSAIHKLFLKRGRHYTTDEMHEVLSDSSTFVQTHFPGAEVLQVGDLSLERGGLAQGHASHQNGLDADIVYLRHNGYVQSAEASSWEEDFVVGQKASANFNLERNFELFKFLVQTTPVTRIFVDAVIKNALCQYALKTNSSKDPLTLETLRRLRPQALHRTHFHLRLGCPENDRACTPQSAPPEGEGCEEVALKMILANEDQSC